MYKTLWYLQKGGHWSYFCVGDGILQREEKEGELGWFQAKMKLHFKKCEEPKGLLTKSRAPQGPWTSSNNNNFKRWGERGWRRRGMGAMSPLSLLWFSRWRSSWTSSSSSSSTSMSSSSTLTSSSSPWSLLSWPVHKVTVWQKKIDQHHPLWCGWDDVDHWSLTIDHYHYT